MNHREPTGPARAPSSPLTLAVAAALAGGCLVDRPDPLDDELGRVESAMICNGENWEDVSAFASEDAYRVAAQYGTAVADIGGCTGELYNARYLVTAAHCGTATRTARFGRFAGGDRLARGRARDLGMTQAEVDALPLATLTDFTCTYFTTLDTSYTGWRDIHIYRCSYNAIAGFGYVYPGDIWGHFELVDSSMADDTRIAAISYNKASFYSDKRVLLGPGRVVDRDDGCSNDTEHCFEHDADTNPGSSGGAIVRLSDSRLAGLVQGQYDFPLFDGCPMPDGNSGVYNGSLSEYGADDVNADPLPDHVDLIDTAWAGGSGGTWRGLSCPSGQLAIGVIGTTAVESEPGDNPVGNFGLVCAPFKRSQLTRYVDAWTVLVGGSLDTGFVTGRYPFNTYTHEVLSLAHEGGAPTSTILAQRQIQTLCRPGWYLTGLMVDEGSAVTGGAFINTIEGIECTHYLGGASRWIGARAPFGTRSGTAKLLRCPQTEANDRSTTDRAAFGLSIRSGWYTDGLALRCRTYR